MAMHKKLSVGSILFCYHEPTYDVYGARYNGLKYRIHFKVLYVQNRRERTTGVSVPKSIIPTLDKLGIRYTSHHYESDIVYAIGCRTHTYYVICSDSPYPTAEEVKKARAKLEERLESPEGITQEGVQLMEIDFVKDFKEKMSNKDALFSLNKPLVEYHAKESVF